MTVDENDFFRQATLRICRHLKIEKGLSACLAYLSTIMPAETICLEIYEPDINALRIIARASPTECVKTDQLIPLVAAVWPEASAVGVMFGKRTEAPAPRWCRRLHHVTSVDPRGTPDVEQIAQVGQDASMVSAAS